ncbi:uncharacterized protein BJ171DRAFT_474121 [Polychytrium aggregatum]|uniref:uncharacterized protein n=1 Tax=Polychytrium aggregatum TaxID=110093 RepID=UPI0022FE7A28|nr:uncharacterized protein BJ171DRAFT_474121 [Polychytrium aggregatum]KAI9205626.1 hypothetical protein BJ171DRAFT_474121 [Polychytrium aggregatum]
MAAAGLAALSAAAGLAAFCRWPLAMEIGGWLGMKRRKGMTRSQSRHARHLRRKSQPLPPSLRLPSAFLRLASGSTPASSGESFVAAPTPPACMAGKEAEGGCTRMRRIEAANASLSLDPNLNHNLNPNLTPISTPISSNQQGTKHIHKRSVRQHAL